MAALLGRLGVLWVGVFCALKAYSEPPRDPVVVDAMAEMLVTNPSEPQWNLHPGWHQLYETAREAKSWGVRALSVDFWLGLANRDPYYRLHFKIVRDAGLKLAVIMADHSAGDNVGDTVRIRPPKFITDRLHNPERDVAYTSEFGRRNPDLVSIWALDEVLPELKAEWMQFRNTFADYGQDIVEIVVGMQSASELRLPVYDVHDLPAVMNRPHPAIYPGRGSLQISSALAQESLRKHLKREFKTLASLNQALAAVGIAPFSRWADVQLLDTHEKVEAFYARHSEYSQVGQEIFHWMHLSLMEYGRRKLEAAIEVFHAADSPFKHVALAFKVPGIDWGGASRRMELASGLITPMGADSDETKPLPQRRPEHWKVENGFGYEGIFRHILVPLRDKYPGSTIIPISTAMEKENCPVACVHGGAAGQGCPCYFNGHPALSQGESLVQGFALLLEKYGFKGGGENALAGAIKNPAALRNIARSYQNHPAFRHLNLLRASDVRASPLAQHMIRNLTQPPHSQPNSKTCPSSLLMVSGSGGEAAQAVAAPQRGP